jgi:hypothetical protein
LTTFCTKHRSTWSRHLQLSHASSKWLKTCRHSKNENRSEIEL